jgi:hypothetical protein
MQKVSRLADPCQYDLFNLYKPTTNEPAPGCPSPAPSAMPYKQENAIQDSAVSLIRF